VYSFDVQRYLIQRAIFRARLRDYTMRKHSVSTQFITAVHLQVLVCVRLQCLWVYEEISLDPMTIKKNFDCGMRSVSFLSLLSKDFPSS